LPFFIFRPLFCKLNLVVPELIIVPKFKAVDIVFDADEHCSGVQVCLICKPNVEIETVVSLVGFLSIVVIVIFCSDFRCCLPVVQGEPCHHMLMEGEVRNCYYTHKGFVV
jgi:hypothetical protein